MRPPLALGLALALVAFPVAFAHNDLPHGNAMTQRITVTEVGYSFLGLTASVPLPAGFTDTYSDVAQEAGHGVQTSAFGLGATALPSKTAARSDLVWLHSECTPLAAPLQNQWTITLRDPLGGAILSTTSPGSAQTLGGSYQDTWPITAPLAGPVGTAWVKYTITFVVVGGSFC